MSYDVKNDFVCHNCGHRFKKGEFSFFIFSISTATRRKSVWDSFSSKNEPYDGGLFGCGKCPDCKSRDTSVFNR